MAYDAKKAVEYRLVLTDQFETFNDKLWSRIPQGYANWNRYMAPEREDLSAVINNRILFKGINNDKKDPKDTRQFLTGGVTSSNKLAMQYGKIEISAKLEAQVGAWPALWMMPQTSTRGWPNDGEIDIIERLGADNFVYHTIHAQNRSNPYSTTANIDPKWNFHTYTLEWTPAELIWKVDGKTTFTYKNKENWYNQFPFRTPFYIQMNMQLGGPWAGNVYAADLPVTMHIDWIKIYAAYQGDGRITKFVSGGKEITESEVKALAN